MKLNSRAYPIDLNADLGEGGLHDEALLQLITSANIACGGHIGDTASMEVTVKLALASGVNIGAHPSYPDREHFGRQSIIISDSELFDSLFQQIVVIKEVCDAINAKLFHVKPHGALYNKAAENTHLGLLLIKVIKQVDPKLKLMILANSPLAKLAKQHGLDVIEEAFADRAYLNSGMLAPRQMKGAVLADDAQALVQVDKIINQQPITTLDGGTVLVSADSICLHGDNEHALRFAQKIRKVLRTCK
ncbi:5-oxoprolinase subunit PxpA [Shewanella eurypsychrophilus]|uniref:5-oxoprolinase subunit PxpA n=1 Tax=Shewanella eurypsychrophilus TaxID=2593656 RepID=A0ABX6V2F7_9GAMM|nr:MULTISPECIES: 5-oxoprolinase subunit PxpA [Shewanella]QFU20422.1 5-oxoprolinase subunit PxpA [Shewanella sp. YLB-09]QPG55999.1 5-oxoprolinase subunit PxpA [Shewanella eurypsychrophilus]